MPPPSDVAAAMSGSVDHAAGVLLGSLSERESAAAEGPAVREARWTLSQALRRFSQLTFAYGVSAVLATVSAVIMSLPGWDTDLRILVALLPFAISVVISGSVLTDLLELLWDGAAGRLASLVGPGGILWGATLILLTVGLIAFGIGLVLIVVGLGALGPYAALTPLGVAFLGVCGLAILAAVVLPAVALGPRSAQGLSTGAAILGSLAITEESVIAFNPPFGSAPFLGWMEGTFPLLNWNAGFGALIAVSAFLIWVSYRYLLPAEKRGFVPVV